VLVAAASPAGVSFAWHAVSSAETEISNMDFFIAPSLVRGSPHSTESVPRTSAVASPFLAHPFLVAEAGSQRRRT
jgi:hypothetical protein